MRVIASFTAWVLVGLAAASPALASEPPQAARGFQADLRLGYARPMGGLQAPAALRLTNLFDSEQPLTLDAGWRFGDNWFLGAYGTIAGGKSGSTFEDLCAVSNCRAMSYRFGAELLVFILPDQRVDPWLGVGVGYDLSSLAIGRPQGSISVGARGFELPRLQAGVDYRFSKYLGFGPYLDFAVGEYTDSTVKTDHYSSDRPIDDGDWHGWFSVGLRWVVLP